MWAVTGPSYAVVSWELLSFVFILRFAMTSYQWGKKISCLSSGFKNILSKIYFNTNPVK